MLIGFASFLVLVGLLAGAVLFVMPSLGFQRKVAGLYGFGVCMGGLLGMLVAEFSLPLIDWQIRIIADGMAAVGLRKLAREIADFGTHGGGVFAAMAGAMALGVMVIWCLRRFSRQTK